MLMTGVALLLVGLAFKAALVPFHMWTPDVYEGAPTSVTAYMAAGAKIAAFAALAAGVYGTDADQQLLDLIAVDPCDRDDVRRQHDRDHGRTTSSACSPTRPSRMRAT